MPRRTYSVLSTSFPSSIQPSSHPLVPYPSITEYTAEFQHAQRIKKKICFLEPLLSSITQYGVHTLRKLILRFSGASRPSYDPYYYPYHIHNIVIERVEHDPYYFRIQFYHYYTVTNQRIDIPYEQQYYDYCALEHFLYQHPILYHAFYLPLIRPTFPMFSLLPHHHENWRPIPNDSTS